MSHSDPDELAEVFSALAHPIRIAIVRHLAVENSSPARFTRQDPDVGQLGTVAYHFTVLADMGLLEIAETRPVRGAVEHIYRLTAKGRRAEALLGKY